MMITALNVHLVSLPLRAPWESAHGTVTHVDTVLIQAVAGDADAWVETCPLGLPGYSSETPEATYLAIVDQFGPRCIGTELSSRHAVHESLAEFPGNRFAKAGLDLCWWALESMSRKVPLRGLFGGDQDAVTVRPAFGVAPSIQVLLGHIQRACDAGAGQVKLKINREWNVDFLKRVREAFPDLSIVVDCNGAFTIADIEMFTSIEQLGIVAIEQPFPADQFAAHADLQKRLRAAVYLDESITLPEDARRAIEQQACRGISVKVGRVGGITPAIEIIEQCRSHGISCYVGSMLESGIGTCINIEVASALSADTTHGITMPGELYNDDVIKPTIGLDECYRLPASRAPYIGREIDLDIVERFTVKKIILR